jgi:hypothetical protein
MVNGHPLRITLRQEHRDCRTNYFRTAAPAELPVHYTGSAGAGCLLFVHSINTVSRWDKGPASRPISNTLVGVLPTSFMTNHF